MQPTEVMERHLPKGFTFVREILRGNDHEAKRLIQHLLDRVHVGKASWISLGVLNGTAEEEENFVGRASAIALFALAADRYGVEFGMDRQAECFETNVDLVDVARDLGMAVERASLPYLLEVVKWDSRLREEGTTLSNVPLPLDILGGISNQAKEWYEETVGASMQANGRHRLIREADLRENIQITLISAYATYADETEAGVEHEVVLSSLRTTYAA